MARIADIERRLLNWARWRIGCSGGPLGYAHSSMEERVDGQGWDAQARIPTSDCEAEETDRAIDTLDKPLGEVVRVFYLSGKGIKWKASQLGCAVATVYARLDLAHHGLASHFSEKVRTADAERQRVEKLQRSAATRSFTE